MNATKLKRHLRRSGCVLQREGARHKIWTNPLSGHEAAIPRHREIKTYTAKNICKSLGVDPPSDA